MVRSVTMKMSVASALLAVLVLSACGKKPVPPPPQIQPPPQTTPGGGMGFVGGSCGGVGGVPLNSNGAPFYSNLTRYGGGYPGGFGGGTGSNSMTLNLFFANQYVNYTQPQQSILGSGTLNFPDLNMLLQSGQMSYAPQTQFCVSSVNLQGGTPLPGIYQQGQVALTMQGVVQIPVQPVIGGPYYPGGYAPQYTQQIVSVAVGVSPGCDAWIDPMTGRLVGCVEISIGQFGQPLRYQAQ